MAESFTSYHVDNDRRFRNAVQRAAKAIGDLTVPLGFIAIDFYKSEQAIFKLQSPGQYPDFKNGGPQSRYAQLKQKKVGFKYPLLVRTGRLATSLLGKGNAGNVTQISRISLTVGTTVPYGIYHQSDKARPVMPLRKFLFIGPESTFATNEQKGRLDRWTKILNSFVVNQAKATGAFK